MSAYRALATISSVPGNVNLRCPLDPAIWRGSFEQLGRSCPVMEGLPSISPVSNCNSVARHDDGV